MNMWSAMSSSSTKIRSQTSLWVIYHPSFSGAPDSSLGSPATRRSFCFGHSYGSYAVRWQSWQQLLLHHVIASSRTGGKNTSNRTSVSSMYVYIYIYTINRMLYDIHTDPPELWRLEPRKAWGLRPSEKPTTLPGETSSGLGDVAAFLAKTWKIKLQCIQNVEISVSRCPKNPETIWNNVERTAFDTLTASTSGDLVDLEIDDNWAIKMLLSHLIMLLGW